MRKRSSRRPNLYTLKFTGEGLADVKALPKNIRNSLKAALVEKIASDPRNYSTPLTSALKGWWSFCWRDYRIIFKIYDDLKAIAIAAVGKHSKEAQQDVYRKLEALVIQGKLAESTLIALRGFSPPVQD